MRAWLVAALVVATPAVARAGALEALADAIAADALGAARGHVGLRVRGGGGELPSTIAGLLRSRLGKQPGVRSVGAADDLAAARAAGFDVWVDVELRLEAGLVIAVGKVTPAARDLWRELVRGGDRGIAATLFAEAPITAEIRAQLGQTPAPARPPTRPPAQRRWAFRQLKTPLDLGAPLLALAAADLDGDGRAELVALTTGEVVILDMDGTGARIEERIPMNGSFPVPRSRFPVGALVVADLTGDGVAEIAARSSERDAGAVWTRSQGAWTPLTPLAGYPVCALGQRLGAVLLDHGVPRFRREGASWSSGPAPSWWTSVADPFTALSCTPIGAESALAVLDGTGVLRVSTQTGTAALPDSGTAFAVADLDGDGRPEVIASADRAPGDGDQLTVWALPPTGEPRPLHRTPPLKGGAPAIAAGDFNGDGSIDAIAAVRLVGSTSIDWWVLE